MYTGPGLASVAPAAIRVAGCASMPCHVGHDHIAPNHGHNFDYEADFDARKLFWRLYRKFILTFCVIAADFNSQTLTLRVFETYLGNTHERKLGFLFKIFEIQNLIFFE